MLLPRAAIVRSSPRGHLFALNAPDHVCASRSSERGVYGDDGTPAAALTRDRGKLIGLISIGDLVEDVVSEQKFIIQQLEHYITG